MNYLPHWRWVVCGWPDELLVPARFFIVRNRELAALVHYPPNWSEQGFMPLKAVEPYENRWEIAGQ
jgi:hypothetical protein